MKLAIRRTLECVGFDAELSQRRCERVRAAAVRDEVNTLHARRPANDPDHLHEVRNRVFGRLPVDVVAEQYASPSAGGPRKDAAHELPSQEMTQFAHRQRGTFETGVVAVHEQHDFLAARVSEPPPNLGLQLLLCGFVRLENGGYTSYAIRSYSDFVRDGRKAT